ncbi:MAG: hypothetical protein HFI68_09075 [Lachnospiraceae bacterium]|nr:hypothetical protein [Lachnospiraceae bacterium]
MEDYLKIGKSHLKHHFKYHLLAAVLLFCLMPFLVSTENLSPRETARTLETYAALMGIVLLVPVFMADQDKDIRDLVRSKQMSLTKIHGIRILEGVVFLVMAEMACIMFLKGCECRFPVWSYFFGTMAGALFLGGMGMFFYSLTDNPAVGYMVPMVYYAINFGGSRYVKSFYLFSMSEGNFGPKYWLAAGGTLFLLLGTLWRYLRP